MANYGETIRPSNPAQAESIAGGQGSSGGTLFDGLLGGQPAPQNLKVQQKDLLVFFRQLAVILQSGVSLAQGLVLIA